MMDNGCMNWDKDFDKMLKTFLKYAQLGETLQNAAKGVKNNQYFDKMC